MNPVHIDNNQNITHDHDPKSSDNFALEDLGNEAVRSDQIPKLNGCGSCIQRREHSIIRLGKRLTSEIICQETEHGESRYDYAFIFWDNHL